LSVMTNIYALKYTKLIFYYKTYIIIKISF